MTSGAARSSRPDDQCCGSCNSQLCTSYLLGLLACTLVVGGVFLAFHRWDYMWLAVSAVGIILILVGAALHYCGTHHATNERASRRELGHSDHLLPSAPTLSNTYSVSQLSLNMLPQYFPTYDTMSLATQADGSVTASQIMQINGQSFLLLPLTESMAETQSLANRLSVQLVQAPFEQSCILANKIPTTPHILQQNNFPTQQQGTNPVEQPYSYPLQVTLPQVKNGAPGQEATIESEEDNLAETPAYLSLEPTYESLEPLSSEAVAYRENTQNCNPIESFEVLSEPMPNDHQPEVLNEAGTDEVVSIVESAEEVSELLTEPTEVQCPILVTLDNEPSDATEERAIECLEPGVAFCIPNASPRSITPEPDQISSPPPSYDEVTHISLGVYGIAYGTI